MPERPRTFSFVDRITELEPGRYAVARFTIPPDLPSFPPCLVAEAVGQLAAWLAMEREGFQRRPVAAFASEVAVGVDPAPGMELDLAVEIFHFGHDAVSYGGVASSGGETVLTLRRCVSPMLPMGDFDDPGIVREDFARLRGPGFPARDLTAAARHRVYLAVRERELGRRLVAEFRVPETSPVFADHFPRRPLFPGTLLLDALMRIGTELAAEAIDAPRPTIVGVSRVRQVKLRAFIEPKALVSMAADVVGTSDANVEISLSARVGESRAASARADVRFWQPP